MTDLAIYAIVTHVFTIVLILGIYIIPNNLYPSFIISALITTYIITFIEIDDYLNYLYIYNNINFSLPFFEQSKYSNTEYFYFLLNCVFKYFTQDFYYLRCAIIFLAILSKFIFIKKCGKMIVASIIFYVSVLFYADSYLLRSSLAAGIIMLGIWGLLEKNSKLYFFICIIIASGFHYSAAIALPIIFMIRIKLSNNAYFLILLIIFIFGYIGLGHFIADLISNYGSLDHYVVNKIDGYKYTKYGFEVGLLRGSLVIYVSIILLFIRYKHVINISPNKYYLILHTLIYALALLVVLSDFEVLADRLFRNLSAVYALAFGYLISIYEKESKTFILGICIVLLNLLPYLTDPGPFILIK